MGSMTAQIMVGGSHRYHGSIFPTHTMSLTENSRPGWTLQATGRELSGAPSAGRPDDNPPSWTVEPTIWVPSAPEQILEDGLLLLHVHVLRDPAVLELVEKELPELAEVRVPFRDPALDLTELPEAVLAELRDRCRASDTHCKLVVTVLVGSSLLAQLPILERYPFELEVCTVSYSRLTSAFGGPEPEVRGSLEPPPGADHRYYDLNL